MSAVRRRPEARPDRMPDSARHQCIGRLTQPVLKPGPPELLETTMLKPGKYKTAAGSTMTISGKHGGKSEVEFEVFDEGGCFDCVPEAYDDDGYLVWRCEQCGGGRAKLVRMEEPCSPRPST